MIGHRLRIMAVVALLALPAAAWAGQVPNFTYAGKILFKGFKKTPLFPHVLDYNGDGKKDLTYFSHDGELFLYLNVGTNTEPRFEHADAIEDSKGPRYLGYRIIAYNTGEPYGRSVHQFVDWNNDGRKDLVFGTTEDEPDWGWIYVWLNSGTDQRPFFENQPAGVSFRKKYGVSHGNDSIRLGAEVSVVETTDGKFIGAESCGALMGIAPWVADWNGDGKKDLLVGASGAKLGHVRYYPNIGEDAAPRFAPECVTLTSAGKELVGAQPIAADLDGDGKLELLLMVQEGIKVFRKKAGDDADLDEGRPALSAGQIIPYRKGGKSLVWIGGSFPRAVPVDWNEDGRTDLVRGTESNCLEVFLSLDKTGLNFGAPVRISARDFGPKDSLLFDVLDYDGDGRKDLIIGGKYGLQHGVLFRWFPNSGTDAAPVFESSRHIQSFGIDALFRRGNSVAPCLVDYDNDGDLDLILTSGRPDGAGLCYFPNTRSAIEEPFFAKNPRAADWTGAMHGLKGENARRYRFPCFADWDGDGKKDLIHGWYRWGQDCSSVLLAKNEGSDEDPVFAGATEELAPRLGTKRPSCPQVADLNSDGKMDLVVAGTDGRIRYYQNVGERGQRPKLAGAVALQADGREMDRSKVTWGDGLTSAPVFRILDWNEDGILDIVQTDEWGSLHLYLGKDHPMQTCAELGGRACPPGMVSKGNLLFPARDGDRCSYSECLKPAPPKPGQEQKPRGR